MYEPIGRMGCMVVDGWGYGLRGEHESVKMDISSSDKKGNLFYHHGWLSLINYYYSSPPSHL